jgi:Lecithin retinol acyltransferase
LNRAPKWGDHIRVRRLSLYWHHGIYISDDRIVQFGSGISDKRSATVGVTDLENFARGGRVEVVVHTEHGSLFGAVGPPDYRANIVHRANWLAANHPQGRYNLIGWNCEHAATFCVNGFRESTQVRAILFVLALAVLPLIGIVLSTPRHSTRHRKYVWSWGVVATVLFHTYRTYSAKVWADLEDKWNLDHPPREEQ